MTGHGWTRRCAGCGLVRPFSEPDHDCPNPASLDTALDMLANPHPVTWYEGPGPYGGAFCVPGRHPVGVDGQYRLVRASSSGSRHVRVWVADPTSNASIIVCREHDLAPIVGAS